jgi:hypothetical protein
MEMNVRPLLSEAEGNMRKCLVTFTGFFILIV